MAYSMMGSRGQVRFRTIGKRAGRGPRGEVGKGDRLRYNKARLDSVRKFDFATPKAEGNVFTRALGRVKSFLGRGNR